MDISIGSCTQGLSIRFEEHKYAGCTQPSSSHRKGAAPDIRDIQPHLLSSLLPAVRNLGCTDHSEFVFASIAKAPRFSLCDYLALLCLSYSPIFDKSGATPMLSMPRVCPGHGAALSGVSEASKVRGMLRRLRKRRGTTKGSFLLCACCCEEAHWCHRSI